MNKNLIGSHRANCAATPGFMLALGVLLGLVAPAARAQSISGVSGTFSHGNSVVLSGSAFGTKATAAPIKWEDFEGHTPNTALSTSDGWDSVDGWSYDTNDHTSKPIYSGLATHAGQLGMVSRFINGTGNSSVLKRGDYSTGFYLDAWYQYVPATPASRNNKIFMLYGSGASEMPQTALTGFCDLNAGMVTPTYASPSGAGNDGGYPGLRQADLLGSLKHLQIWVSPSTPAGADNGYVRILINGQLKESNNLTTVMPGVGYWNQARIGYYVAHDAVDGCVAAGDAYTYWDNVYIDNTQARVELGNAATYSACTLREIQIPTSWSASQVTVTMNQGTFSSGQNAYLYVVTANGAVSPGYQVTLGGTPPTGPGQPGKPVF